jgi:hypothetical protein
LGLGALAAGGAALGFSGCAPQDASANSANATNNSAATTDNWWGVAPEIAESEIVSTEETDFLIIGAGTAGLCAAGTAVDLGLDFIICDKSTMVSETREYFGVVNSPLTIAAGQEVDTDKLLNEVSRYASGKCNMDVIKVWIDESAETLAWMEPIVTAAGKTLEIHTHVSNPTGGTEYFEPVLEHMFIPAYTPPMRNDIIAEYLAGKGSPVRFGHNLVCLLQDGDRITGALFETDEGYLSIKAKNTLLATGGYAANPVLMQMLQPAASQCITASSYNPQDDGYGLKCGIWAGGIKDADPSPLIFDRGSVAPGVNAGYEGQGEAAYLPGTIFQTNIGSQPFMKVNRLGKRFANESTPYDSICFSASYQPGGVWCQVFDSNYLEDVPRFSTIGCSTGAMICGLAAMGLPFDTMTVEEAYAVEMEQGLLMKADTLEELADKLQLPQKEFLAQVERYNSYFDKQHDDEFGKEPYRLSALRQAPYYGMWFGGSLLTTLDGLRINKNMQVLDKDCNVIEGLFAAGDVSGSFFSGNYPEYLVGVACGRSSTEGRHVARFVAGDI